MTEYDYFTDVADNGVPDIVWRYRKGSDHGWWLSDDGDKGVAIATRQEHESFKRKPLSAPPAWVAEKFGEE
jgi:hypothetical protein